MTKRTYEVQVQATALRTIKVRASSGTEAMDIAVNRIRQVSGPWFIDFPGSADEHYMVWLDNNHVGPDAMGGFEDEDNEEDDDE